MATENVLDPKKNVIGTIETDADGSQTLRGTDGKIKGYYDAASDHTRASDKSILAKGNKLRSLIC